MFILKNKWQSHTYAYAVTYMCLKNSIVAIFFVNILKNKTKR